MRANPWLLGLLGGLFLIGSGQVRRFEVAAATDIRARLQGPAQVDVRIRPAGVSGALASATIAASRFTTDGLPLHTEPDRSTRGIVQELRLDLSDFRLGSLRIDRLRATIPDCRFDYALAVRRGKIRLSRSGEGTGSVSIREADLEAFVRTKFGELDRPVVKIDDGRIVVSGHGRFLFLETDFRVDAKLASPDGRALNLEDARIEFDGEPADPLSSRAVLQALNPVIHVDRDLGLEGAFDIVGIELRDGAAVATGRTRIPVASE